MASDPGKFSCQICSENLRSKTGACVATVSLFSETSNKEFSNACDGKPVVFAELLRVLGIVLVQDRPRSVCKKCARKIVNCYKLFTELQQAFIDNSGWESSAGNTETTCTPQKSRKENRVPQHQRSPTGITPTAKRQKSNESSRLNTTQQQESERKTSKRSLFEANEPYDNYSAVNREITNLMNLPVEAYLPPISKMSV